MDANYSIPFPGYGQLRYNPQMPLANMNQGLNPIMAGNPMMYQPQGMAGNQGGSPYQMSSQWQFGMNYNHIAASQAVQGIGAYLRQNNQRNDFKSYNRTQQNPLLQIPNNPNTSQQAEYGMNQFKRGGKIKMADGGDPGKFTSDNIMASKASGMQDVDVVNRINKVLSTGSSPGNILNYDKDTQSLINGAFMWKQQNQGKSPQDAIQGFFNRPADPSNSQDYLRLRLGKIGYGADAMYNNPSNPMKKGGPVKMAEGGKPDFDNFKDFDEEDFEDLKDEMDKYFSEKGKTPEVPEKQDKEDTEQKEEKPEDQDEPMSDEAINFMNGDFSDKDEQPPSDQNGVPQYIQAPPLSLSSNVNGSMMPDMSGHPLIEAFKNGIAKVENAGYGEGNKNSSAFGKYQFTNGTLEAVREMQFKDIPKKDFVDTYRSDPKFQERVMDAYAGHLLDKFPDPHQAATAFFLGEGKANYYNQPDYNPGHGNISVGSYLKNFDQGYNKKQGGHIMNKPGSVDLPFAPQMKMADGGPGPKPPITVNDPNDPRLKSYNDSLGLYNKSIEFMNDFKNRGFTPTSISHPNVPKTVQELTNDGRGNYFNKDIPNPDYTPWDMPIGRQNFSQPIRRDKMKTLNGKSNESDVFIDHASTPLYAQPQQPYQYQPIPEAKRSQVQGVQSNQYTPNVKGSGLNPQAPIDPRSNFSFTGRDDQGQQTTRYFSDLDNWTNATNQMGYRNREVTNNGKEAHATGYQFQEGGEYELTNLQIAQLKKQGYQIDIIK